MLSEPLLTPKEAAERLRSSVPTLARWRVNGNGPAYVKNGGRVFYRDSDLESFIQSSTRSKTRGQEVSHAR